jgi:hypothetical protein
MKDGSAFIVPNPSVTRTLRERRPADRSVTPVKPLAVKIQAQTTSYVLLRPRIWERMKRGHGGVSL